MRSSLSLRLSRFCSISSLSLVALAGACDGPVDEAAPAPDEVAVVEAPVLNGNVVTTDNVGIVFISTSVGSCSGSLLDNRRVLTAAHCFDTFDLNNPGMVTVTLNTGAMRTASSISLHPDEDAARVVLSSAMPFKGSTTALYNPLYGGHPVNLYEKTLPCFGWGANTLNGGGGTLRTANLFVEDYSDTWFDLDLNSQGQQLWKGDSGGSCTANLFGTRFLTGSLSQCDDFGTDVDWCEETAGAAIIDWFYSHNISTFWPGLFTSDIDASVVWPNGKAYFFKGSQYIRWDISDDKKDSGFPANISTFWPGMFSSDIDAATVWPNGKAYFFKGSQYIRWDIAKDQKDAGFPANISTFWPGMFSSDIDAVTVIGQKAYFFKGSQYIRWDIPTDHKDAGFPAPISGFWKGLFAKDIDTAAAWPNGKVYFFKGGRYDRFDVALDRTDLY